eukprot:12780186-Alexandrium_andersonii.AAC.1
MPRRRELAQLLLRQVPGLCRVRGRRFADHAPDGSGEVLARDLGPERGVARCEARRQPQCIRAVGSLLGS